MKKFKDFYNKKEDKIPAVMIDNRDTYDNPHEEKDIIPAVIIGNRDTYDAPKKLKESKLFNILNDPAKQHEQDLINQYSDFTPEEEAQIENYGTKSFEINAHLLGHHHLNLPINDSVSFNNKKYNYNLPVFDRALTRKPIGKSLTLFSGTGSFDPRKQKSKSGHIHLPAYTSTSLSPNVAYGFARKDADEKNDSHMLKITMKPTDHGAYISHFTGFSSEKEFLLPRNTTLKITKSERSKEKENLWIHHAEIDNDVDPERIQRDPSVLAKLPLMFRHFYENEPENHRSIINAINDHLTMPTPAIQKLVKKTKPKDIHELAISSIDPKLHRAILEQPEKVDKHILRAIARLSVNSGILHKILDHKDKVNSDVLENVVKNSYNNDIHNRVLNEHPDKITPDILETVLQSNPPDDISNKILDEHPDKMNYKTLSLMAKTYNPIIHNKILDHSKILANDSIEGKMILNRIATNSNSSDVHKKILNTIEEHPHLSDIDTLHMLSLNSNSPEVDKRILTHPKLGLNTRIYLSNKYGTSSRDDAIKKMDDLIQKNKVNESIYLKLKKILK